MSITRINSHEFANWLESWDSRKWLEDRSPMPRDVARIAIEYAGLADNVEERIRSLRVLDRLGLLNLSPNCPPPPELPEKHRLYCFQPEVSYPMVAARLHDLVRLFFPNFRVLPYTRGGMVDSPGKPNDPAYWVSRPEFQLTEPQAHKSYNEQIPLLEALNSRSEHKYEIANLHTMALMFIFDAAHNSIDAIDSNRGNRRDVARTLYSRMEELEAKYTCFCNIEPFRQYGSLNTEDSYGNDCFGITQSVWTCPDDLTIKIGLPYRILPRHFNNLDLRLFLVTGGRKFSEREGCAREV